MRREVGFEMGFVLKGIMLLCVRHGSGFKPAVQYLRGPTVDLPVFFDQDAVQHMLVQIGNTLAGQGFKLFDRSDADRILRINFIDPDWNAGTPEPVAADVPILGLGQPIGKAFLTDVPRHPMHGGVVGEHLVPQILNPYIPGIDGPVDQGRVCPLAERITMLDR